MGKPSSRNTEFRYFGKPLQVGGNFMETAYIQFQAPKSATKAKTENSLKRSIKNFTTNILTKVLPVANRDFENKIDNVEYWLLECDKLNGIPQREIGLDKQGRVIMKMPFDDNCGYWTDNNLLLDDFKEQFKAFDITKDAFEQQWTMFDNLSDFQTYVDDFHILSTGVDGGHKYISANIEYNGAKRKLTIFFADKASEKEVITLQRIKVSGRLIDEGEHQPLVLLDAKLIGE